MLQLGTVRKELFAHMLAKCQKETSFRLPAYPSQHLVTYTFDGHHDIRTSFQTEDSYRRGREAETEREREGEGGRDSATGGVCSGMVLQSFSISPDFP